MVLCVPLMIINLVLAWIWLQLLYLPLPFCGRSKKSHNGDIKTSIEGNCESKNVSDNIKELLQSRYNDLGPMSRHEKSVLGIFIILVILWMSRSPGFVTGWEVLFPPGISDATPAILISLILFIVPATEDGSPMLTWQLVQSKLAWGVIILLGGGFALAEGAQRSCLTHWVGAQLSRLSFLSAGVLRLLICVLVSCVTQVASNVATASMLLPVLLQLSAVLHINPLYLMLPSTLVSSLAFFLPVSTAPNAIVHAASGMRTWDMMKAGAGLTVITMMTTIACSATIGVPVFSTDTYPDWAPSANSSVGQSAGNICNNL